MRTSRGAGDRRGCLGQEPGRSLRRGRFALAGLLFFNGCFFADAAVPAAPAGPPVQLRIVEGRDRRFSRLSSERGLSQSRVDHIIRDDLGFMWFGTYDGLNRYDGYRCKVYRHEPNKPDSLNGVFISALLKDRSGAIWIGVDQSLDRFDPVTERFIHFPSDPNDPRSPAGHVEHMCQDREGMLWLATRNGLDRLHPTTGEITHFRNDPRDPHSLASNDVRFVLEDSRRTLWVATAAGLDAFDRRTGKVRRYPNFRSIPLDRICEDRSGGLWVSSTRGGGLASLDRETGRFTLYKIHDRPPDTTGMEGVSAILEDRDGMLWLASKPDGVLKFDRGRGQITRYRNDPSDPLSLSSNSTLSFEEDLEGGIWVGTDGGGVNRFPSRAQAFTTYRKEPGNPNSLDQNYALSVYADSRDTLWIGTSQLNRLDRRTGQYTFYRHNPADVGSISNGTVHATIEDRSGTLWFGTWGGGLNRFDRRTDRFKAFRHDPADPGSLSHDFVLSLFIDRSGTLWVGTEDGLNRFDPQTERFTVFRNAADPPPARIVRVIAEDAGGALWLGTYEWGLRRLDPLTGSLTTYRRDADAQGGLSNNRINALCVDHSGTLWIGTQDGLNRYDASTGRFSVLHDRDGLPNNAVQGILEDAGGHLWVSTGGGLSRFNPRSGRFSNFYATDGLASEEFSNSSVYCKSARGEMFFGTANGITSFYPEQISENSEVPPIVLTDFRLFNSPVPVGGSSPLSRSISYSDVLALTHEHSIFSLEFSALSYANPGRNRYRYRMDGLETRWNVSDSDHRFVTYTTLAPGAYVFRVQGSNNAGVWNEKGVTLPIRILPAWWMTTWFRGVLLLLVIGAIFFAHELRVRTIQARNQELAIRVDERTAELRVAKERAEVANESKNVFLASVSHDLRTPLNGILGYAQLLQQSAGLTGSQKGSLEIIRHSGEHLLALINDILDLSRIEAGKLELHASSVDLSSFLDDIIRLIRLRTEEKGIEFVAQTAADLPRGVVVAESRLREVLLNLLDNAVKFTERGRVMLRIQASRGRTQPRVDIDANVVRLRFEVEDTGVGMTSRQIESIFEAFAQAGELRHRASGAGLGLAISRRIVRLMGGDIQVRSEPGCGSSFCFELCLPETEAAPELAPLQLPMGYSGPPRRVLVVDDERDSRTLMIGFLTSLGFEVQEAEDGEAALQLGRQMCPDLIVMDVRMPGMNGLEATRRLRQLPGFVEIPVVAVSASASESDVAKCLAAGATALVPKPIDFGRFLKEVGLLLELTWVYAPREGTAAGDTEGTMVVPPLEELSVLHELALLGSMRKIRERADHLTEMDIRYRSCAARIRKLALGFQSRALVDLVEQWIRDQQRQSGSG